MSEQKHKRGTAVIWTQYGQIPGSTKKVMGIVYAHDDPDQVTIEIVEPNQTETQLVTVPAIHIRPI